MTSCGRNIGRRFNRETTPKRDDCKNQGQATHNTLLFPRGIFEPSSSVVASVRCRYPLSVVSGTQTSGMTG